MTTRASRGRGRAAKMLAALLVAAVPAVVGTAPGADAAPGKGAATVKRSDRAPRASHASLRWTTCDPVQVMAFSVRIHIRCATSVNGIRFFAVGTANAQHAARMLSLLTTAQVAGRTVTILYDADDLSGAQIGCLTSDCRLIQAAGFGA